MLEQITSRARSQGGPRSLHASSMSGAARRPALRVRRGGAGSAGSSGTSPARTSPPRTSPALYVQVRAGFMQGGDGCAGGDRSPAHGVRALGTARR